MAGSGLGAYRVNRRVQGIDSFEFTELKPVDAVDTPSLTAVICCSGFLLKPDDATEPFRAALASSLDRRSVFTVRADPDDFLAAGLALDACVRKHTAKLIVHSYVRDYVIKKGGMEVLKRTALAAVFTAVALPLSVYSSLSTVLDNRCVAAARPRLRFAATSASATRPTRPASSWPTSSPARCKGIARSRSCVCCSASGLTTQIGSSLGAATVFRALLELHERGLDHLVCDAILVSSPLSPSPAEYKSARAAVVRP